MTHSIGVARAKKDGFTLIELLVVIAIIAILAAILFPVFTQAKQKAKQAGCFQGLRQVAMAFTMYMGDADDLLPDRRDLKTSLPGGYRPWTSWPASDPRAGWAAQVLSPYTKNSGIWNCEATKGTPLGEAVEVRQEVVASVVTRYWLWRFDRPDDPVPLDNLWGKSGSQAVSDLQAAGNPQVGFPESEADIELAVDPYFPGTISTVRPELKSKSVHFGGRNRLFLDSHVRWLRDIRTN